MRAPGRPPRANPTSCSAARSSVLRRARCPASPGTCSAKMRRGHLGAEHRKRRTRTCRTTSQPAVGRSAILRVYPLCTRCERRRQPGQRAVRAVRCRSTCTASSAMATWSTCRPLRWGMGIGTRRAHLRPVRALVSVPPSSITSPGPPAPRWSQRHFGAIGSYRWTGQVSLLQGEPARRVAASRFGCHCARTDTTACARSAW